MPSQDYSAPPMPPGFGAPSSDTAAPATPGEGASAPDGSAPAAQQEGAAAPDPMQAVQDALKQENK